MSSVIDICNLALSHIGQAADVSSIDPPENSIEAEYCARFYPIARDTLLEAHAWDFALRREPLAALKHNSKQWRFCYAVPTECLQIISIFPELAANDIDCLSVNHARETTADGHRIIWANTENAIIRYTQRVQNSHLFTPAFTVALSWKLAAMLAGAIIKSDTGAQYAAMCESQVQSLIAQAKNNDARQFSQQIQFTPAAILARQ